jgi:carboxymethylenebutenolidase
MLTEERLASGMIIWSARPDTQEPRPAVIFLHERYGPVDHPKDAVQRFADAGFVAVLPDMFHRMTEDRGPIVRGEAFATLVDETSIADLDEVMTWLRSQSYVVGDQIGIMGVCQTGREPLLYAAERGGVAALVLLNGGIYGRKWTPTTDHPTSVWDFFPKLECPVLCLLGEIDNLISLDDLARFRTEMEQARKSYHAIVFRDTPHGWINDTMPGRYRKEAAEAAWSATMEFLKSTLGGDWDRSRVIWKFESDTSPDYDFSTHVRHE